MPDEQIIYLDPNDDLNIVREKIEKFHAQRIIMVVPQQTQLRSHVGWRLLHVHARELGNEVQVISADRQMRAVAKAAGFRVSQPPEGSLGGRTRVPPSQNPRTVTERKGAQRGRTLFNRGPAESQAPRRRQPTVPPLSPAPEELPIETLSSQYTGMQQENPPALPQTPAEPESRQNNEDAYPSVEVVEDDASDQPYEFRIVDAQGPPGAARPLAARAEEEYEGPYLQSYETARQIRAAYEEGKVSGTSNSSTNEQGPISTFSTSHFSTPPAPIHTNPFAGDIEELSTSILPAQRVATSSEMQDSAPDIADIPTAEYRIEDGMEEVDTQNFSVLHRDEEKQPDDRNAKKGLPLFNRKPKLVPNANAPAPLESFDEPVKPIVPEQQDEETEPVRPRSRSGPIPIPLPLPQTGAATKPLTPHARGTNGPAEPTRSSTTGKQAAIGAAAVGAGAAAAFAGTRTPATGGGQPPIRGNVSGSGGGSGRHRRTTRRLLAILLMILTLLLLAGIAFASPPGQDFLGNLIRNSGSSSTNPVPLIIGVFIIFPGAISFIFFLVSFSSRRKSKAGAIDKATTPPKQTVSNNRVSSPPQNVLTRNIPVSSAPLVLNTNGSQPNTNTMPQPAYIESNIRSSQPQQSEKAKIEDRQANQTNAVQHPGKLSIPPIISEPVVDQPKRQFHKPELKQQSLEFVQKSHQPANNIPFTHEAVKKLPTTPPSARQDNADQKESHMSQPPPVSDAPSNKTKKIFYCYAREDEELLDKLKAHLRSLEREGHIAMWYDRNISAGEEWKEQINIHINEADIILLLFSSDFIKSDYCYSIEMKRAMELRSLKKIEVIPIILRPVHWKIGTLGELQALPKDGKPVKSSKWHNEDEAFFDIVEGIRKVVNEMSHE